MADDTDGAQQAEKPRYNLIDEPWIPVRWLDGTLGELGIRDTLIQAGRIALRPGAVRGRNKRQQQTDYARCLHAAISGFQGKGCREKIITGWAGMAPASALGQTGIPARHAPRNRGVVP